MNEKSLVFFSIGLVVLMVASVATSGIDTSTKTQSLVENNGLSPGAHAMDSVPILRTTSSTVKNPNSFTEVTIGEPQTLDPAIDYETAGGNILQNVYETLLWYDRNTTTLVPWLATEIPTVANGGISTDGLNYTFTIKPNIRFQDNTTMTVSDVVFSIQRTLKMHDASGPVWMIQAVLDDYLGAYVGTGTTVADYLASQTTFNATWIYSYLVAQPGGKNHIINQQDSNAVAAMAVQKVATDKVRFRLTHVYPAFLSMTAYTVMDVLSQNYTRTHDLNVSCLGTGPYALASWNSGVSMHLRAWSNYWGTKARIPDVYILENNDVNARLLMLQSGDADYASLPISPIITDNTSYFEDRSPSFNVAFFVFNYWINSAIANSVWGGVGLTDDFFQNVHMRLAFEHLFNVSIYIHSIAHDNALPLNGVIPRGMQGYNASVPAFVFDLVAAKNEMMQVPNPSHPGQSFFQTGFVIPLFFNTGNLGRQAACQLLQQGIQALGALAGAGPMSATVNGLDWGSAYLPAEQTPHNFMPMYLVGWAPDYADPDDYAFPFLHTGGAYPIGSSYGNSTIDQMVLAAATELNASLRTTMYMDISGKIHEDPPYIFIDQTNLFLVFRSWVHGEYSNPMWSDMYYAILSKNSAPHAAFTVTPSTGDTSTDFEFDASNSYDDEEATGTLAVQWDWNGDGVWDTAVTTDKVANHVFASPGNYDVRLNVIDSGGLNNSTSHSTVVVQAIPEMGALVSPLVVMAAALMMIGMHRRGKSK